MKLLTSSMMENSDEYIRRKLIDKYNAYYRHWQDLNMLVALFAMIGMTLCIVEWESSFSSRSGNDPALLESSAFFTDTVVFIVSCIGATAVITKFYFESVW